MSTLRRVPAGEDAAKPGRESANGEPPDHDDDEEDENRRHRTNITLGLAVIAVVAVGIWLVDALLGQRRIDNCMAQGRRNCGQVEVPFR